MDFISRLPGMTDDALASLRVNAERLLVTGSDLQKNQARDLLPALVAEIEGGTRLRTPDRPIVVRPRRHAS